MPELRDLPIAIKIIDIILHMVLTGYIAFSVTRSTNIRGMKNLLKYLFLVMPMIIVIGNLTTVTLKIDAILGFIMYGTIFIGWHHTGKFITHKVFKME